MARIEELHNVKVFNHDTFTDLRGDLFTIWEQSETNNLHFNHDKVAISKKDVLRGLHTDKSWKLITCLYGKLQLVVVNYDENSDQYLDHTDFVIDSNSSIKQCVLVPPGFLNGHLVLSDEAVFYYKWCYEGNYPDVKDQKSVRWDDPAININWMCENPILSERDKNTLSIKV
jgi:dTDP-4-dehydrorhamnose 3,5-epimerase